MYFAASSAPTGWLKANGASLSTTTYANLFGVIGYVYGGSGGSFTLPDLRGEFVRGWADGRAVDTGRVFGSAQTEMVGPHTHPIGAYDGGGGSGPQGVLTGGNNFNAFNAPNNTGTENRPRNIALLACIKF
jgi:microcystin-dependent protein